MKKLIYITMVTVIAGMSLLVSSCTEEEFRTKPSPVAVDDNNPKQF